ncbi:hypothetical protein SVIOM342S_09892 [Streptomyces violaceorubidus]
MSSGVLVVLDDDQPCSPCPGAGRGSRSAGGCRAGAGRRTARRGRTARRRVRIRSWGGQPDALGLAAGEGARRAVQREVVQADVDQGNQRESIPFTSFSTRSAIFLSRAFSVSSPSKSAQSLMAHRRGLGDRLPMTVTARTSGLRRVPSQVGAGHLAHVALAKRSRLASLSASLCRRFDEGDGALEGRGCTGARGRTGRGSGPRPGSCGRTGRASAGTLRQTREGDVGTEAERVREGADQAGRSSPWRARGTRGGWRPPSRDLSSSGTISSGSTSTRAPMPRSSRGRRRRAS